MDEEKIHIAIIDDGISGQMCNVALHHNVRVSEDGKIEQMRNSVGRLDMCKTHGTICAAILNKYIQQGTLVSSVKVLNDQKRGEVEKLYVALDWCIEAKVDVVNLSLGTRAFWDQKGIRNKVNEVANKGLIIVAATSNSEYITYPASFCNVIGVSCDMEGKLKEREWNYQVGGLDGVEVSAFSNHEIFWEDGSKEDCGPFNSFAAPMITAIVANLLSNNKQYKLEDIKYWLYRQGKNEKMGFAVKSAMPDWIEYGCMVFIGIKEETRIPCYFRKKEIYLNSLKELAYWKKEEHNSGIDTLIIQGVEKFLDKDVEEAINISINMKWNIIFVDEYNIEYNNKIRGNIKRWFPSNYLEDACTNLARNLETPLILITGEIDSIVLETICELRKLFTEDGYHALAYLNRVYGIFCDCEYLPLKSSWEEWKSKLLKEETIACGDLFLLGMNTMCPNKVKEYDIIININRVKGDYIGKIKMEEGKQIVKYKEWNDFIKAIYQKINKILR